MNSPPPLPRFARASAADQVAASLREGIESGVWDRILPSERELALHFGVSRPSVHAAILELARTGMVENRDRRLTRILARRRRVAAAPLACMVTPFSRQTFGAALAEDPFRQAVKTELAAAGIGWNDIIDARLGKRDPGRYLAKLAAEHGPACWLIDNASAAIQQWFEKSRIPTLVLGSCYPGVRLPSIDSDYRAIGLHAAGQMLRQGHRHLALIVGSHAMPGDLACRDGIMECVESSGQAMSVVELTAPLDLGQFRLKLDRLLKRRPRPTVVFTMLAEATELVYLHLLRARLRVPDDISLISRDSHTLFDLGAPEITRYISSNVKKARVTVRVVRSLLAGRPVSARPFLLSATFIPGSTFAAPPSAGG